MKEKTFFVQSKNLNLYGGKDVEKRCCIDQWVDFTLLHLPYSKKGLQAVDQHLETNTYVVGYTMTLADICVFGAMRASDDFDVVKSSVSLPHLSRWYKRTTSPNFKPYFLTSGLSLKN